jgi:hypothetical protein
VTKRMIGREIMPGVVAHVSEDISDETIKALQELAKCVMNMPDEELAEVKLYADYLHHKSNPKNKVGRPRKDKNGRA